MEINNPETTKSSFMYYKGKPLVRCKNVIYYGNIEDGHIIRMESVEASEKSDIKVSSEVSVEMIEIDPNDTNVRKIVKTSKKDGLYQALDIAKVWLDRVKVENVI